MANEKKSTVNRSSKGSIRIVLGPVAQQRVSEVAQRLAPLGVSEKRVSGLMAAHLTAVAEEIDPQTLIESVLSNGKATTQ